METTLYVDEAGDTLGVYSDKFIDAYTQMGAEIQRATNIEFDNERKLWVAILLETQEEIAACPTREEAIKIELEYLAKKFKGE